MSTGRSRFARATVAMLAMGAILTLTSCSGGVQSNVELPEQIAGDLPKATVEQLDASLTEAMALAASSGAIAGVWAPWSGSWVHAAGTDEPGGGTAMSTDMHFRAGGITKSMTCDVLLGLVDDGAVKLSDAVTTYLPTMQGVDTVTLGQLCQSTSGIGDYSATLLSFFRNNPTRQWSAMELISDGVANPASGVPGAAFSKSDTGYVLLGLALEAATNTDWHTLYDEYVFGPLDLDNTSYPSPASTTLPSPHPHSWEAMPNPAGGFVCNAPKDESELSNSMAATAGGVVSTVDDLHRYAQAYATGALHTKKTATNAWKTVPLGADTPDWQGYGPGGVQLGPLRGQSGYIPGFITAMLADPETGLTVVVVLNNSTAGPGFAQSLAMKLAAIASKSVPASGEKLPTIGLPWSEEQMGEQLHAGAVCQPAA